ncbi:MAG: hypothetical protein J1E01_06495 [Acetatifactor sp.]|nr:hypothetical protein [Acetatifactor sp.]
MAVGAAAGITGTWNSDSFDARIASGGGRVCITMDRYQSDWDMVRKGWETQQTLITSADTQVYIPMP